MQIRHSYLGSRCQCILKQFSSLLVSSYRQQGRQYPGHKAKEGKMCRQRSRSEVLSRDLLAKPGCTLTGMRSRCPASWRRRGVKYLGSLPQGSGFTSSLQGLRTSRGKDEARRIKISVVSDEVRALEAGQALVCTGQETRRGCCWKGSPLLVL